MSLRHSAKIISLTALPLLAFAFVDSVSAATTEVIVTALPTMSIDIPSTVNLSLNAATNDGFGSTPLAVTIGTNNSTGYKVFLSSSTADTNLTDGSGHIIPTLSAATTASNFPTRTWGYSLNSGTTYNPMTPFSSDQSGLPVIDESDGPVSGKTTTVDLAAKVDLTVLSGIYSNTITIAAVTNVVPFVMPIEYMQEITPDIIADMPLEEQFQLKDSRDNKTYYVSKLKDGNVWMTQNLALGGTEPMELTPADTNITSDWTLPASVNTGDWWTVDDSYSNPEFYAWSEYEDDSETKYGNYYNWTAAIAMDNSSSLNSDGDIATTSICPKGWHLPTGDSDGEFMALMNEYGWASYNLDPAIFTGAPLSFVFSSNYLYGVYGQGGDSNWWSSTVCDSNVAYDLYGDSGGHVGPGGTGDRRLGFSVRCVAGS